MSNIVITLYYTLPLYKHITYLSAVLTMQCPRCRQSSIFKHKLSVGISTNLAMHTQCITCGQPTEIEVGFYYGTGYVSYALTVALTGVTFVAWWLLLGFSVYNNSIFYWLGSNALLLILLQPWLMRLSRSLWLSWFVAYNPNWAHTLPSHNERVVAEQMEGVQDINSKTIEP